MKLTSPKNICRTARENSPTQEPLRLGRPGLGKRGLPKWLLLVLFAAGSFGVTYALVTWSGRLAGMPSDGSPAMVWIPGGEFIMGTDADSGLADEKPAHRVRVAGFWMDPTEVTNAQFRAFVAATGFATTAEKPVDVAEMLKQSPPGTPGPDPEKLLPRCPGVPADGRPGERPAGLLAVVALDAGGQLAALRGA
jgi:formylglycine-generating enzyme required for sulfatase activity